MVAELTFCIAHVEDSLTDAQFHPRPVGTDEGLGACTQTKDHRPTPIPTILDERIAVDDSRRIVLMKQGVVVEEIAQGPAQQVRGWGPWVVLEPGETNLDDGHGLHIIIPQ